MAPENYPAKPSENHLATRVAGSKFFLPPKNSEKDRRHFPNSYAHRAHSDKTNSPRAPRRAHLKNTPNTASAQLQRNGYSKGDSHILLLSFRPGSSPLTKQQLKRAKELSAGKGCKKYPPKQNRAQQNSSHGSGRAVMTNGGWENRFYPSRLGGHKSG